MRKKKSIPLIFIITLTVITFSSGYMAYAMNNNNNPIPPLTDKTDNLTPKNNDKKTLPSFPAAQTLPDKQKIDLQRPPEPEVDTSQIKIPNEITEKIKDSDSGNFEKNIANYKKALVQLNVPQEFRNPIEKLIKDGKQVPDILTLYQFLYDNYGTIDELAALVDKLESGEALGDIIREYNSTHPEFVPTKFEEAYLENLMKTSSIDDILIADRLSQKGLAQFADLIAKRQSGQSWKEINTQLGVLNTADQLPRMSLTHAQVNQCMQDSGMNEKDANNVLVLSWKTGKDYKEIIQKLKSGEKQEDISAESYLEKYR